MKPRIRLDPKYNLWQYKGKHYACLEMILDQIPTPEVSLMLEDARAEQFQQTQFDRMMRSQANFDCMMANDPYATQLRYANYMDSYPRTRMGLFGGGSELFGIGI